MKLLLQIPPLPELEDVLDPNSPLLPALSTVPWWIWTVAALVIVLAGIVFWMRLRKTAPMQEDHRTVALEKIHALAAGSESPYVFSILVCDILRRYCVKRFGLRATTQTSPEFLESIREHAGFVAQEKEWLAAFLSRCDEIKFGRAAAEADDNRMLATLAENFVKGGPA